MITIHSTPTTVVLTPLRDHPFIEVVPEEWVFSFSGVDTHRVVNVTVVDQSPSPWTYQSFDLEVDLRPLGMWYWSLWSNASMSGSPMAFGLATSIE
jgi:hypothetical protein